MEAYCVKCRTKREMKYTYNMVMKNGKPAVRGICPVCGTKMFRIGVMVAKSKWWNCILKVYFWLWHDVCDRPEPFTDTMKRSAKNNPLPWILIPMGIGGAWYLLVCHLAGWW